MFRRFLYGRYGNDQFNLAILIFSLAVGLATFFTNGIAYIVLSVIQFSLLGYWLFRAFSRDHWRRRRENNWFLSKWRKVKPFFASVSGFFKRIFDKNHKYFKCPNCKSRLRVPRGRGEITVTCPRCKNKFDKKS